MLTMGGAHNCDKQQLLSNISKPLQIAGFPRVSPFEPPSPLCLNTVSVRGQAKGGGVQQARAEQHDAQQHLAKGALVQARGEGVPYIEPDQSRHDGHPVQGQVVEAPRAQGQVGEELDCRRCWSPWWWPGPPPAHPWPYFIPLTMGRHYSRKSSRQDMPLLMLCSLFCMLTVQCAWLSPANGRCPRTVIASRWQAYSVACLLLYETM